MNYKHLTLLLAIIIAYGCKQSRKDFIIADKNTATQIVYDPNNSTLDSITAHLLAKDIEAVSGKSPEIHKDIEEAAAAMSENDELFRYRFATPQVLEYGLMVLTEDGDITKKVITERNRRIE
jgi:hypothetical protein